MFKLIVLFESGPNIVTMDSSLYGRDKAARIINDVPRNVAVTCAHVEEKRNRSVVESLYNQKLIVFRCIHKNNNKETYVCAQKALIKTCFQSS